MACHRSAPIKLLQALTWVALLALLSTGSIAEIYTWIDDNGVKQFSDRPPEHNTATRVRTIEAPQISTVQTRVIPPDALPRKKKSSGKETSRGRVLMYSAEWCGVCKRAASYFRKKGIPFREKDIDASKQARREFEKLGGSGVPLILVGKRKLSGFSAASFEQIYYK